MSRLPIPSQPSYPSQRAVGNPTAAIAISGTVSDAVDISAYGSGAIYLAAEFNNDAITFQGSNARAGTYAAIHDSAGASVTFTAAAGARWYALPASLFGFSFIKIVTNNAVAAAATIPFSLKS